MERVRGALLDGYLLRPHERVVVAVSGGPDSVCLLHLLMQLQPSLSLTLAVAHVDHQLRPDSADDAAFVRGLAERCGLAVIVERRDVRAIAQGSGWSLEDAARRIRHACLVDVARRFSAGAIALGHTADDQSETVLMRLIRGAGLLGLGAMAPKRLAGTQLDTAAAPPEPKRQEGTRASSQPIWLIRPLLGVWRREVLDELASVGLPYRHDPSNDDRHFLRNRIRHELIPLLEQRYNPNIKAALVQLAEQSRCDSTYLEAAARRQWKRLAKPLRMKDVALEIRAFRLQPEAIRRQLVRQAIQRLRGQIGRFEFRHWLEVERLFEECPAGTVVDLPGGVRMVREGERVRCQVGTGPLAPRVPEGT